MTVACPSCGLSGSVHAITCTAVQEQPGLPCATCAAVGYHRPECPLNIAGAPAPPDTPSALDSMVKVLRVYRDLQWAATPEKIAADIVEEMRAHGHDLV